MNLPELPIREYLPRIAAALKSSGKLILSAEPGSGKTTLVPPALLELTPKKVLLVEPRRVQPPHAGLHIGQIPHQLRAILRGHAAEPSDPFQYLAGLRRPAKEQQPGHHGRSSKG